MIKRMKYRYSGIKEWLNKKLTDVTPFFNKLFGVLEVIFYTTLPTIILVLFSLLDNNMDIKKTFGKECYIHGEFLLYSIALISSAYTTMKVYKKQNTSLVTILLILVAIMYAIAIKTEEIRETTLLYFSIGAFLAGVVYTWHAMSLKNNYQNSFPERDANATEKINNGLNFEE